jgi:hypothetical protein
MCTQVAKQQSKCPAFYQLSQNKSRHVSSSNIKTSLGLLFYNSFTAVHGKILQIFNIFRPDYTGYALQRQNVENLKQIFPKKEFRGLSPNFHIHGSVTEIYIPTMGLPVEEICRLILGIY